MLMAERHERDGEDVLRLIAQKERELEAMVARAREEAAGLVAQARREVEAQLQKARGEAARGAPEDEARGEAGARGVRVVVERVVGGAGS